jgi:hypothetical protein
MTECPLRSRGGSSVEGVAASEPATQFLKAAQLHATAAGGSCPQRAAPATDSSEPLNCQPNDRRLALALGLKSPSL